MPYANLITVFYASKDAHKEQLLGTAMELYCFHVSIDLVSIARTLRTLKNSRARLILVVIVLPFSRISTVVLVS